MSDNTPQGTPDVPPAPAAPTSPTGYATPTQDSAYAQPSAYPPPPAAPTASPGQAGAHPPPAGYAPPAGYPQQPYGYGAQAPYPYAAGPKTNGLAITSLVASIAAFVVLPFVASIVAVITGHIALKQLRTSGENGRGMAIAGVIVGWVGIAISLLFIALIAISISFAVNAPGSTSFS